MCKKLNYFLFFSLILSFITSINAQIDPGTENLTHSWTFNNGTANDVVGSANGTLMGNATVADGSLFTVNDSSWIALPADVIGIDNYDEITIEVWFASLAEANTNYFMLVSFGDTKSTLGINYYFMTPARGDDKSRAAISIGVETSPWSGETGADGPELDDGELHHMVSTLNLTDITLYIDGQLQQSTPLSATNFISGISTAFAYLAKSTYDGDATWKGEIQEFNIFNKALSADEVLFLFNKGATTGVEDENTTIPKDYVLSQNYPNPFNPTTTIEFAVPKSSNVKLVVYDVLGREVAELINQELNAGYNKVEFDASNLTSGIYFYSLKAGDFSCVKKLMLLK
ncbi:MAG: LamG-like jellyroll fold domain-containing protein [bacterium]